MAIHCDYSPTPAPMARILPDPAAGFVPVGGFFVHECFHVWIGVDAGGLLLHESAGVCDGAIGAVETLTLGLMRR